MSIFDLDTDILSLWQHSHAAVSQHVAAHAPEELAITVITVQEQLDGWHARLSRAKDRKQIADLYQRLADTARFLSRVHILPYSKRQSTSPSNCNSRSSMSARWTCESPPLCWSSASPWSPATPGTLVLHFLKKAL